MRRIRPLLLACLVATASAAWGDCLFVNNNDDPNTVSAFQVAADGSLTPAPGSPFATGWGGGFTAHIDSVALLPGAPRVYVSNSSPIGFGGDRAARSRSRDGAPAGELQEIGAVAGFDIAANCALTPIAGSPWTTGECATGIAIDPTGSYLYVANFCSDTISAFSIGGGGALTELGFSPISTPGEPFDLELSPDGARLFVSHDFQDAVGVYDVAGGGGLTPVAGSPFAAGGTEHGLALDPAGARVYVSDLGPNSISGFSVGGGGALAALPGSPYAAGEVIETLVAPAGDYLFASNNEDDTLGVYAVAGDGSLSPVAGSPFTSDDGPAGLVTAPDGSLLFVANGGFGGASSVSVYSVGAGGALAGIAGSPFATGGTNGEATGIAYYALGFTPTTWVDVPALGPAGLALLAGALALAAVVGLRRRRA